jgi:hypothetical protein
MSAYLGDILTSGEFIKKTDLIGDSHALKVEDTPSEGLFYYNYLLKKVYLGLRSFKPNFLRNFKDWAFYFLS